MTSVGLSNGQAQACWHYRSIMTIDRREFAAVVIGSVTGALATSRASAESAPLRVNGDRLNEHLTALSRVRQEPAGRREPRRLQPGRPTRGRAVAGSCGTRARGDDRRGREPHGPARRTRCRGSSPSSSDPTSTRCRRAATTTATSARSAAIEVAHTLAEQPDRSPGTRSRSPSVRTRRAASSAAAR